MESWLSANIEEILKDHKPKSLSMLFAPNCDAKSSIDQKECLFLKNNFNFGWIFYTQFLVFPWCSKGYINDEATATYQNFQSFQSIFFKFKYHVNLYENVGSMKKYLLLWSYQSIFLRLLYIEYGKRIKSGLGCRFSYQFPFLANRLIPEAFFDIRIFIFLWENE